MSLRDDSYNLDPGVKHRGDKEMCRCAATPMTWAPRSASTHATRRAGPGPRGDKGNACGARDPGLRRDDDREGTGVTYSALSCCKTVRNVVEFWARIKKKTMPNLNHRLD